MGAHLHRRRYLWAAAMAAVLTAVGAVWLLGPHRLLPGGGADGGVVGLGDAPGIGMTGTAPESSTSDAPDAGKGAPTPAVPASATPTPIPDARPSPSVSPTEKLRVSYEITKRGLLSYTAEVTIINSTASARRWHVVAVRVSGLDLTVTPIGAAVDHENRAPDQCFYSTPDSATVPSGGAVRFAFTVTSVVGGILGGVQQVELAGAACDRTA